MRRFCARVVEISFRYRRTLLFFLVAICGFAPIQAQTVDVPLGHWAYDLLDRLETRGLTSTPVSKTRPLTRDDFVDILSKVMNDNKAKLSGVEREQIAFLFYEFRETGALRGRDQIVGRDDDRFAAEQRRWLGWLPAVFLKNGRNLLSYRGDGTGIFFDPLVLLQANFSASDTLSQPKHVYRRTSGVNFWGYLGKAVGFWLDARETEEWSPHAYPTGHRLTWPGYGYAEGRGSSLFHDETVAYIHLSLPRVGLQLGKNSNRWGPGRTGALALNDAATSYDQIRLRTQLWKLRFTFVHGFLHQYPPLVVDSYQVNGVDREKFASKYLAAHRLEITPTSWLQVGLHETVIYGERAVELAYLNPIMFYRSAEHYLGDRDNATMGLDCSVRLRPGILAYGEFFMDDFSFGKIGKHWYGNKTAWLAGVHLTDIPGVPRSDWRFEIAHIEPYVYTHTFPIAVYKHYDTTLGHPVGPNAEVLSAEWLFWQSRRLHFFLGWRQQRHGENFADRNVGGDLDRAFEVHDNPVVNFLDGIRTRDRRWRLALRYELFRNFMVYSEARLEAFSRQGQATTRTFGGSITLMWNFF